MKKKLKKLFYKKNVFLHEQKFKWIVLYAKYVFLYKQIFKWIVLDERNVVYMNSVYSCKQIYFIYNNSVQYVYNWVPG